MTALLNPRVWIALAVAGVLAWTHWLAYDQGGSGARAALSAYMADAERKRADAERLQRDIEAQRDKDITEIATNAQTQINALAAERDAAVSAADSLRSAAASAARRACPRASAPSAGPGQSGPDPLDLLVGVLDRHSRELVELGEFADRLRISGLACEASYDALSLDGAARVQVPLRR